MELGALAESGNKVLGSRTLVSVLPPALLSVIVFVLLATGAPGTPSAALLVERLKDLGGAQVALLFFGVLVVAVILQPLLGNRWEIGAPAQPEAPLDGGSGALSWADDVPGGGGAEGI
jgi:uncharacterized membrane protein YhaH (DUF805 family)